MSQVKRDFQIPHIHEPLSSITHAFSLLLVFPPHSPHFYSPFYHLTPTSSPSLDPGHSTSSTNSLLVLFLIPPILLIPPPKSQNRLHGRPTFSPHSTLFLTLYLFTPQSFFPSSFLLFIVLPPLSVSFPLPSPPCSHLFRTEDLLVYLSFPLTYPLSFPCLPSFKALRNLYENPDQRAQINEFIHQTIGQRTG